MIAAPNAAVAAPQRAGHPGAEISVHGATIHLFNGHYWDYKNPGRGRIDVETIAHSLANTCRFTGHCIEFYCPTPEQRILTADLRWVPAGDLKVGDELFGFDEHPIEAGSTGRNRRRIRPSMVTHAQAVKRQIIRLELSDGSTIRASHEHPWLVATRQSGNQKWLTARQIHDDVSAGRRRYMHKFIEPWQPISGRDVGWLAGLYDGEGFLQSANRKGSQLGVSQKPGLVLDEAVRVLSSNGFNSLRYAQTGVRESGVVTLQMKGGWREIARILGSVRPIRLLDKFTTHLRNGDFSKQFDGSGSPLEVVRSWVEPDEWVAGLETSTHTYICEGYGAHNCVAQHCVLMSHIVPPQHALWALCHEPEEPVTGDLNKPFKILLDEMTGGVISRFVKEQERPVLIHVFGLDPDCKPDTIKPADHIMLATEQRDLMPKQRAIRWDEYGFAVEWEPLPPQEWSETSGIVPLAEIITPWTPAQAKAAFLRRYLEIVKGACGEQEGTLKWSQSRRAANDLAVEVAA